MYMANHDIVLIAILRHPRIGLGIDVRSHTPPALEESRDWKEKNPQAHVARPALQRILPSDYLTAGQTSIMNQGITQEQRERVAHSSNVKGQASASSQEDNRRVTWNANTYVDTGKGKSKTPEEREQERGRLRRWEHDNC